MTFGSLIKQIQTRCRDIVAADIRTLLNDCLIELSLTVHFEEKRVIAPENYMNTFWDEANNIWSEDENLIGSGTGQSRSVIDISDDIIKIKEVYVNDENCQFYLNYKEYVESDYTSNNYCYIANNRKIYFPEALSADDEIILVIDKVLTPHTSLNSDSLILIPDHYLPLIENYIFKEIFLLPETEDIKKHSYYQLRYDKSLRLIRSNNVGIQNINFGIDL
ncbi:MAG: hypothetical protein H8E13_04150 [Actinobacteria bacterium]|nr:hypothetical protein [Actinomycetota bacterium]